MRKILLAAICIGVFALAVNFASRSDYSEFSLRFRDFVASLFFIDSTTKETLKSAYEKADKGEEKLSILIVPGHDSVQSGTEFRGMKEASITLDLGEELYRLLAADAHFDVRLSRTRTGYDPSIAEFLREKKTEIDEFVKIQKALMSRYVALGKIESRILVEHNKAPVDTAYKLYGINKWANENGADIILHIHFNDYPRSMRSASGIYSGFSVYIPESQYSNAKGSRVIAEAVYKRLARFYPSSNLPKEDAGIVEDQELIAIGSNNTVDGAALLIEYGYIYEPHLQNIVIRQKAISDLAFQTYLGIMDFFESDPKKESYETRLLPYKWQEDIFRASAAKKDTLSLQAALIIEGLYPPAGSSLNECPMSGNFGACTEKAVKAFQGKYGILPQTGYAGEKTRAKLNELYGAK
ncbi:MAG: hypothetical protein A2847_01310 [Candidatus Sungbacteria bacterium RIFCSPHIGHO2_01_FULL_50_25]|uniref:MurNAc-LAA domain-containing protein n=1 Tax=Candidatus Sungbacteria bacterium RIFCSPHIGHO2_01_FULL_50_25 TaxID=1802265 RepID=A0A1G2K9J9_9BACT|nr:MAG: hypothetical protein A2847_01310 [Candidatus Sungbacteria bacterium RIFCSPHIGHO2_01_FULL_50_25]